MTLRWLIQQGDVIAIPRTSKPERLSENLAVFDFELTAEEMDAMGRLTRARLEADQPAGMGAGVGLEQVADRDLACRVRCRRQILAAEGQHADMTKPAKKPARGGARAARPGRSRAMPTMDDVARADRLLADDGLARLPRFLADQEGDAGQDPRGGRGARLFSQQDGIQPRLAAAARLRHHPADPAGLDLSAVRRRRARGVRRERRRLSPAEHRLCAQARAAGDRPAGVAARAGDPAALDRPHARDRQAAPLDFRSRSSRSATCRSGRSTSPSAIRTSMPATWPRSG